MEAKLTYIEVLEKWATYCEYDRQQTRFDLLSANYRLHKVCELIEMLLNEYDSTGMLGVIYADMQFRKLLKDTKISMLDVIEHPEKYQQEKEMYALFKMPAVANANKEFIDKLDKIYVQITNGKLLGDDKDSREKLLDSIESVIESIKKCKVDMFIKGGAIGTVENISTKLHIFNTLAECLLSIEKSEDGMYFCFIRADNTADCFFSFFIKSNGTIISVNDRINEAYIGQHEGLRNGRWTDGKVDGIFPYNYIFNYSDYDYKNYPGKYEINESKLDLYNLGIEVFMPIIVAMLMLALKYKHKDVDLPLYYLDSFLPENQRRIESYELMPIEQSSLVAIHNDVDLVFDNDKLLKGEYATEFTRNESYLENGCFHNNNQLMVDIWGDGFVFDASAVFNNNNICCLTDKNSDCYVPEFVGTEKRIRLQVYYEARRQLAEYMDNKIYQAWVEYGKTEAVKEWYREALLENKEFLYKMMLDYEERVENGEEKPARVGWTTPGEINIYKISDTYPDNGRISIPYVINCDRIEGEWKWICSVNGCVCNTWFLIRPNDWKDIELLTGKEVPKIVKGWKKSGHRTSGNPHLSVTDKTEMIGTPFEHSLGFGLNDRYNNAYFEFVFGFSKSGWNKLKKERRKTRKNG